MQVGVDLILEASQEDLRRKSIKLCETFLTLVQQECSRWDQHSRFPQLTALCAPGIKPKKVIQICNSKQGVSMALPEFKHGQFARPSELVAPLKSVYNLWLDPLRRVFCSWAFRLVSPSRGDERGSQICLAHPEGYAVIQVRANISSAHVLSKECT